MDAASVRQAPGVVYTPASRFQQLIAGAMGFNGRGGQTMTGKMKTLGQAGISVGRLAFGGNVFGWTVDEPTSFKLLDAFTESGLNFIDTADLYSKWKPGNQGGESETIIGRWLKQRPGRRDRIVIATKVGMEMGPDAKGLSRSYILRAADASLQRLQIERIDLYQAHTDDKETPLDETLGAFGELIKQGKVRAIGASNYDAARLSEALSVSAKNALPRYETLQPHYNLAERAGFEKELEPLCLREKIGVISYFSLAKGFLTGKYRSEADLSKSVRGGGVKGYLNERGNGILRALDDVAGRRRSTPARVALAWLIARPSVLAPIASATNLEQVKDLVEATRLDLDEASIQQLNQASE